MKLDKKKRGKPAYSDSLDNFARDDKENGDEGVEVLVGEVGAGQRHPPPVRVEHALAHVYQETRCSLE